MSIFAKKRLIEEWQNVCSIVKVKSDLYHIFEMHFQVIYFQAVGSQNTLVECICEPFIYARYIIFSLQNFTCFLYNFQTK